jgi:hypothetical protein
VEENYLPVVVGVAVVGDRVLSPLKDPAYFAKVTVDPEAGTLSGLAASTWPPDGPACHGVAAR